MIRVPTRLVACLVLAVVVGTPARAAELASRALVDSVAAHYARLAAYHFEGVVRSRATGDSLPSGDLVEMPFAWSAVRPRRLHNEFANVSNPITFVSDGDSLWLLAPVANQYTVQRAPRLRPGSDHGDSRARMLMPLLGLAQLGANVGEVSELGRDTVVTSAGPVDCRRLRIVYLPDSTQPAVTIQPRVVDIDPARRLVLRDSVVFDLRHPQYGAVRQVTTQRFALADDATGGPDSLYHFRVPSGATRIAQPELPVPALAGKPAPPFTLAALDGARVSLAALKGKVVVLDFWATWCGPCRRWLPIVAGLEPELGKHGVRVFAVNVKDPVDAVKKYLRDVGIAVPVLLDVDGKVGDQYEAHSIPLTVIVGRDGKVAKVLLGLHTEDDLLDALGDAGVTGL